MMKYVLARLFRCFFRVRPLRSRYYGLYTRIFRPLNLFGGLTMRTRYREEIILDLQIDDWIQQQLYFLGEYEEKEIRLLEQCLAEGDVFVDVGANIGLFSLVASKRVGPAGAVYAFEPVKKNHARLVQHATLNKAENIRAERLAVSDRDAEITLFLDEREQNNGMATAYPDGYTWSDRVRSVTLNDYFRKLSSGPVRLIKIDIEGGEYAALLGMQELLQEHKPLLLIEINEDTPYEKKQLWELLSGQGYTSHFIARNGTPIAEKLPDDRSNNYLFVFSKE